MLDAFGRAKKELSLSWDYRMLSTCWFVQDDHTNLLFLLLFFFFLGLLHIFFALLGFLLLVLPALLLVFGPFLFVLFGFLLRLLPIFNFLGFQLLLFLSNSELPSLLGRRSA